MVNQEQQNCPCSVKLLRIAVAVLPERDDTAKQVQALSTKSEMKRLQPMWTQVAAYG